MLHFVYVAERISLVGGQHQQEAERTTEIMIDRQKSWGHHPEKETNWMK